MTKFIAKLENVEHFPEATELHKGFYVVEAETAEHLHPHATSVENAEVPIKLQSPMKSTSVFSSIPEGGDWPRLRAISRTHPLQTSFKRVDVDYINMPELFIVDTGINFAHTEFIGLNTNDFYKVPSYSSFRDDAGHGTAMAAAAAGVNLGVAGHVLLQNVKAFGADHMPNLVELCNSLLAILNHHVDTPAVPKVVNCSWCVGKSSVLETVFNSLVSAGIVVIAAAGNDGKDISQLTPQSMENVIVVAASDKDDVAAGFNSFSESEFELTTNNGDTLDMFAPGVDVVVAKFDSNTEYMNSSGTSISAAIVSGAACEITAMLKNTFGKDVHSILVSTATKGALLLDLKKFKPSQNNLVFLLSANETAQYQDSVFYADVVSKDKPTALADITRVMAITAYATASGEVPTYSLQYENDQAETELKNFLSLDTAGGIKVTINFPDLTWADDENLRLMSFIVKAQFNAASFYSPKIIFYVVNPNKTVDVAGEISTATETLNAPTLLAWSSGSIIK